MLAGYDLESGRLTAPCMRSPRPNRNELSIGDRSGLDEEISPKDQLGWKRRSVSFAPLSNEEDSSGIAIGKRSGMVKNILRLGESDEFFGMSDFFY